jgi:hypothetical protein
MIRKVLNNAGISDLVPGKISGTKIHNLSIT